MDTNDDCGYQVELFIYDLTKGLARTLSPALLGKQIDGVWHTGIVAYGREYFFGSEGIESCKPGGTILNEPDRIEALGESQVPYQLFLEYIFGLGESAYRPGAYDLLKHNCNNFSDDIAQFLCGRGVPKAILQLPEEVLNTPLGLTLNDALKKVALKHANSRSINFGPLNSTLRPALNIVRTSYDDPEFDALNDAIDQVRLNSVILEERRNSLNDKLSKKERKERRREKRERKEKRRKERGDDASEDRRHKKRNLPPIPSDDCGEESSEHEERRSSLAHAEESHLPNGYQSEEVGPESALEFERNLNTAAETVNSLSLEEVPSSAKEEDTVWEPVDDFWGNQETQTQSQQQSTAVAVEETIDPPPAYTDNPEDTHTQDTSTEYSDQHTTQTDYNDLYNTIEEEDRDQQEEVAYQNQNQYLEPSMEDVPAPDNVESSSPQQAPPPSDDTESEPVPEVEREPPILFKEHVDARRDFDELVGCCMHMLSTEEQQHMEELRTYVVEDDGAWALSESFGDLFTRLFNDTNIPDQARLHLIRILAVAALKDDVILLLHQDRKDHTIMNFANKVEHVAPDLQEAIALFFCNMFEHLSPSEWLLYISEWNPEASMPISNIRVTTKVAVNALLHANEKVQEYGTALMYNLGTKEVKTVVFDDVAPELAMAILQYFSTKPKEELMWRTVTALCRFCYASSEVPSLIKMIGPAPSSFKGVSERIDVVIEEIDAKLSRVRLF